jgi:Na+/glutamate symporter
MKTENRRYVITGAVTAIGLIYCLVMYRYVLRLFDEGSDLVARNVVFFGSLMIPIYVLLGIFYLMTLLRMKKAKEHQDNKSIFSDIVFIAILFSMVTLVADVVLFQSLKNTVSAAVAADTVTWLSILLAIRFIIALAGYVIHRIDHVRLSSSSDEHESGRIRSTEGEQ